MINNPFYPYQQPIQQIQNSGFIPVRSIQEALNYPVAPGNSVTFKDECSPYVYTKTQGFSQLDRPIFEKYRLVKEEDPAPEPAPEYALRSDIDTIQKEIEELKALMKGDTNE